MAKILVVDDDPDFVNLTRTILHSRDYEVITAANGEKALAAMRKEKPDLVLLDIMMPDMDGWEVCRRLRELSDVPIIFLTARSDIKDVVRGLEMGADDYIVKPFSPRELLARIRAALRRAQPNEDEVVAFGELRLDSASHEVKVGDIEIPLGPTEYRLLEFFMLHPDRVYSRTQLLDRVWGGNVYVEERTVDVHIRRLRKALTASGYDRMIRTVRGAGYRFSPGSN